MQFSNNSPVIFEETCKEFSPKRIQINISTLCKIHPGPPFSSPYSCSASSYDVHHPTIAVHHILMYITLLLQCIIWTLPQLEQSSVDRQKQGSTRIVGLLDCIIGDCLHIDVLMSNSCLMLAIVLFTSIHAARKCWEQHSSIEFATVLLLKQWKTFQGIVNAKNLELH